MFANHHAIPEVTPVEAHRRQQEGAVLVDVREPGELAASHASGARHVPLGEIAVRHGEQPRDLEMLL